MKARRWLGWSKKETIEELSLSCSLLMQSSVSLFVQCILPSAYRSAYILIIPTWWQDSTSTVQRCAVATPIGYSHLLAIFNFKLSYVGRFHLQTLIRWSFPSSNSIDPDWTSTSPELQGLQQRFWVQGQPHPQQLEGYEKVLSFPSSSFKFNWPSWWNKQRQGRQNRAVFGEIPPSLIPWMVPCLVLSC